MYRQTLFHYFALSLVTWYGRRDSNPHALRHQILSLARLPISPRPRLWSRDNQLYLDWCLKNSLFGGAKVDKDFNYAIC